MAAVTMMKMRVFKEANVSLSMSRVEQSDGCGTARYQSPVDLSARCYLTVFQPPNALKFGLRYFFFFIVSFFTLKRRLAAFAALFAYSSSVKASLNLICGRASGFTGTWLRLIRSTTKVQ